MERNQLVGKRLALLLAGRDDKGEDDWEVFTGIVREDAGYLFLDRDQGTLELLEEWIARI